MAGGAAVVIARERLNRSRQLLVVTVTRSAAAQIRDKIRHHLKTLNLSAGSFTVQTIHALSLQIASQAPDVSGLDPNFVIITDVEQKQLLRKAVEQWLTEQPRLAEVLLEGRGFDGEDSERLRRLSALRAKILPELAETVIKEAKSSNLRPADVFAIASQAPAEPYPALLIAAQLFECFEAVRRATGEALIDYDDMTQAALRALTDPLIRQQWQQRVFAVFEDEAQDSSWQQKELLEILATDPAAGVCNYVRVGDPNQAINSTFTPADPHFFRLFCQACVAEQHFFNMTQAGRSHRAIIAAANVVHRAANQNRDWGRNPPFSLQDIEPVPDDDPQPNANPEGPGLSIRYPATITAEVHEIGTRVCALLQANPGHSAAILVRHKAQASVVYRELEPIAIAAGIPLLDAIKNTRRYAVPGDLLAICQFLQRPQSAQMLRAALEVLYQREQIPKFEFDRLASQPEVLLYPSPLAPEWPEVEPVRAVCHTLLRASTELAIAPLLLLIAQRLGYDADELATTDKLVDQIYRATGQRGATLPVAIASLTDILSDVQFKPVDTDSSFTRANQITLMTLHSAKGLDWDYVFLPFIHDKIFPGKPYFPHPFLGDLDLGDVARAQLRAYLHQQPIPNVPDAQNQANQLKAAEELRLLYVGMTRAKRLLALSAARQAPYSWGNPDNLSDMSPSPLLAELAQRKLHIEAQPSNL